MSCTGWLLAAPGPRRAAASDDSWNITFTLTGKPELQREPDDGHIRMEARDRNEVAVRVYVRGWSVGTAGDDVRIIERQEGSRILLDVRAPRTSGGFNLQARSIQIELSVPKQADFDRPHRRRPHPLGSAGGGRRPPYRSDVNGRINRGGPTLRVRSGDGSITIERP